MPYDNNGGVPLSAVGDDVQIVQTNNVLGQDGAGTFTVAPGVAGYAGATLVFEKCFTAADFNFGAGSGPGAGGGIWTPLTYVLQSSGTAYLANATVTLPTVVAGGTTVYNFAVVQTTGYYAVRMRLTAIVSGSLIGSGFTFPVTQTSSPASLAALQALNSTLQAQVLAQCYTDGNNYFDASAALVLP